MWHFACFAALKHMCRQHGRSVDATISGAVEGCNTHCDPLCSNLGCKCARRRQRCLPKRNLAGHTYWCSKQVTYGATNNHPATTAAGEGNHVCVCGGGGCGVQPCTMGSCGGSHTVQTRGMHREKALPAGIVQCPGNVHVQFLFTRKRTKQQAETPPLYEAAGPDT